MTPLVRYVENVTRELLFLEFGFRQINISLVVQLKISFRKLLIRISRGKEKIGIGAKI